MACGGAGQAGDLMHDFRAGMMMRLSPRKQLLAQLAGIPIGILGAVPTYALFAATYPIGGEQFPRPAAVAWRAVAEVLTGPGGGGLPAEAKPLMAAAALFTAWVRTVERAAETRAETQPELPRRALDQAVDDKPHERGDSVHHPPRVFHDDRHRGRRFGVLGAAGQGAPRGSRVHSGERVVGRGGGDGGGHRAGVHGVRDHRAGNVRCARVDVSVKLLDVIRVAPVVLVQELAPREGHSHDDELSAPESWARTWRAMGSSGEDGSKLELGKIVEVSGKGLGVVATRDAVAGEVIAREQGPMAISLSRDQLGVRCCRCARRAARSSATRRCDEGCGAMWCSPECAVADTHLHADSGECSFLLDIGPDPASRCVSRAVRGIGERAGGGGGGSRATGSRSRTTCACCCARDASGYSRETRRHASPRSTRTLRLQTTTTPSQPAPRDPTRCSVASRPSRRTFTTNAGVDAEETAAPFPRMRRPTTPEPDSSGRERRSSSSQLLRRGGVGREGGSEFPRPARVAGAVYRTLSRFNHSCAPNCTWSFVHESESKPGGGAVSVNVRAIKPVKEGDELTISYVDPTVGRAERREQLWAKYRFECACPLCAGPRDANRQLPGWIRISRRRLGPSTTTTRGRRSRRPTE